MAEETAQRLTPIRVAPLQAAALHEMIARASAG
jgi:hypothetical protein